MAPKHKLDDGSKAAVSCANVSENTSKDIHIGPVTMAKVNEKKDVVGRKWKADYAKLDVPDMRNEELVTLSH